MRCVWILALAAISAIPAFGAGTVDEGATALEGEWVVVGMEDNGTQATEDDIKGMKWLIQGTTITATDPDGSAGKMRLKLDPKKTPKEIQITSLDGNLKGTSQVGIYEIQAGRLRICYADPKVSKGPPKEFSAPAKSGCGIITLEKKKP